MITSMMVTGKNCFVFVRNFFLFQILALIQLTAEALIRKWETAKTDLEKTEQAFRQLSETIDNTWILQWSRDEEKAMRERGKALEIYDVSLSKGAHSPESFRAHHRHRILIRNSAHTSRYSPSANGKGMRTKGPLQDSVYDYGWPRN